MPKTSFRPETDGFAFANSFQFDKEEEDKLREIINVAVPTAALTLGPIIAAVAGPAVLGVLGPILPFLGPLLDPIILIAAAFSARRIIDEIVSAIVSDTYGLCGGMAFAALDYYKLQWVVPRGNHAEDQPTRTTREGAVLRNYLWERLIQSQIDNGVKFLIWTVALQMPGGGGSSWVLDQTKQEWEKLKRQIDAGEPCPLGLIGTTNNLLANHQVLAYGYEDNGNGTSVLYLYDSNCPGKESKTTLDFNSNELVAVEDCSNGDRGPLRGFFCETYSFQTPPIAVGLSEGLSTSPSGCAKVGYPVEVKFVAKNVGFHRSPPLALKVKSSDGLTGGETTPKPLENSQEGPREKASITFQTPGTKSLSISCYVEVNGVGAWKNLPALTPELIETLSILVNPRLKIRDITSTGGGSCSVGNVEGARVRFSVDTSPLVDRINLKYRWTVVGAVAGSLDQPVLTIDSLPAAGTQVTVSVTVTDSRGCEAEGTRTFSTVTSKQADWFARLCELANLTKELDPIPPDPLDDPIRSGLKQPAIEVLGQVRDSSVRMVQVTERLLNLG
jgi:hypothetical protein